MVEFKFDDYNGQVALPLPIPDMAMMPRSLQLIASKVPDYMKPAVMNSAFTALGAHVSNYRYKAINGRYYEPAFMHITIGRQAAGKSNINIPINIINEDLIQNSIKEREKEQQWRDSENERSANEKGKKRPYPCIQVPRNDMTAAALSIRLKGCELGGNKVLFINSDEVEILRQIKANSITTSALIRLFYDRALYGQERATAKGESIETAMRMNINTAGTFESVRKMFSDCLVDGTVSRINFSLMVKPRRMKVAVKEYDEKYKQDVKVYVDRLLGMEGDVDIASIRNFMSKLEDEMFDWIDLQKDENLKNILEDLLGRILANVHASLVLLYYMEGKQFNTQMQYFAEWKALYQLTCLNAVFGDMLLAANDLKPVVEVFRNCEATTILHSLPNEFTTAQFKAARKARGENDNVGSILNWWCKQGKVTRVAGKRGCYKKCGHYVSFDNLESSVTNEALTDAEKMLDDAMNDFLNGLE